MAIARNKALSARRRRMDAELDETIEATVADPADNPEVVLHKKERGERLRQARTNLSAKNGRSSTSSTIMRSRSMKSHKFSECHPQP